MEQCPLIPSNCPRPRRFPQELVFIMLEWVLNLVSLWRPSRYRGIGIRGGFVLGILWAGVSVAASELGWNIIGLVLALLGSAAVGYRLERIGGAIAVVVFSLFFWHVSVRIGGPWPLAASFGFVMGLVYGAATTEKPKNKDNRSH
jgi:hypothetical protein